MSRICFIAMPSNTRLVQSPYLRLLIRTLTPMLLWFGAANGVAYWSVQSGIWEHATLADQSLFCLIALYLVPSLLNIVVGFMAWGYAMGRYGTFQGSFMASTVWMWQWLWWWALTRGSIAWFYLGWYGETVYH